MRSSAAVQKRSGFTLIELLVVIAIIAILASILFPVYSRVRENARRTKCLSNVKQLVMAFTMYADDHDETLPIWCMDYPWLSDINDGEGNTWDRVIFPYYRNSEMLHCPSNPFPKTNSGWTGNRMLRGYAMTGYTAGTDQGTHATPEFLSEFPAPSRTVLIFEKGGAPIYHYADAKAEHFFQSGMQRCLNATPDQGGSYEWCQTYTDRTWHTRGKVFGYVDGHAKSQTERTDPFTEVDTTRGKAGYCKNYQDWPQPR
jgi:prepilin-type N-terminal cleavage/methylation domain-containing protein